MIFNICLFFIIIFGIPLLGSYIEEKIEILENTKNLADLYYIPNENIKFIDFNKTLIDLEKMR